MILDQTEQEIQSPAQRFVLPIRIYYEDTDAGGIVYHASYLRFMERARTDLLRHLGHERSRLSSELKVQFVVTGMTIKYVRPALLDDLVQVSASVKSLGYARLIFDQTVERNGEVLTKASVTAACVKVGGIKPAVIPKSLREKLKGLM
ncbi:MAG TPA: tol-pal system-associated acyl-CoA thioesterase [Burkholderiales bacterium]|nr:tol-pal system-associated acyl-CoA thioesterase [Burkholderiales bacterium]